MKPRSSKQPNKERSSLKNYFVSLFDRHNVRNKEQLASFCKKFIFAVVLVVEAFIVLVLLNGFTIKDDLLMLIFVLALEVVLTISQAFKLFVVKGRARIILYILDAACACGFSFLADGAYTIVLYMLILTEFYVYADTVKRSLLVLCLCAPVYLGGVVVNFLVVHKTASFELLPLLTQGISSLVYLLVHFLVVQIAVSFYRQYVRLDSALKELDESKKKLEEAYVALKEVTVLEERQRIAKDIHDNAGHSITTVIMQTESAKRIIEINPKEAKQKIVAANLQAKHALEELRNSVHVLSGLKETATLEGSLKDIIHESTDGTGIIIRWDIQNVNVFPTKFRFLCNTLKEGISNGLRHGGATAFWFECREENGQILFLLSDNGKGIDLNNIHFGFGLSSMQERARAFGGELELHSETGEGFEMKLTLPIDNVQ